MTKSWFGHLIATLLFIGPAASLADKPPALPPAQACKEKPGSVSEVELVSTAKKEIHRREGRSKFGESMVEWNYDQCAWLVTVQTMPARIGAERTLLITNAKKVVFYMPGM
jgi:hypothetical protein